MLRLFRLNDPYRLGIVLLVMVGLRLPYWISGGLPTIHEQHWLLVGERLSSGAHMYSELWDTTGPLPALVYGVLHSLFGLSPLAHQIVALCLVFLQCIIFNNTMLARKAYNENTYIPGLLYGLFASISFDMFTLSPLLIGLTFILLAYRQLFSHLQSRAKEEEAILLMGLMMGLAALCYLPLGLLLLPLFVSLGLFSSTLTRRYFLIGYGFLLPIALSALYYYLAGSWSEFFEYFIYNTLVLPKSSLTTGWLELSLFGIPALLLVLAMVRVARYPRFINFQSRLQQIMLMWLVISLIIWWRAEQRAPFHLLVVVPILAFYLSHYLLLFRKKRWAEVAFWFIWVPVVVLSQNPISHWVPQLPQPKDLVVEAPPLPSQARQKSMWVLGDFPAYYAHAQSLGTAFYQWEVYASFLEDINEYQEVLELHRVVADPLPEVVVDPDGRFPKLFQYFPDWETAYVPLQNNRVWVLKP